MEDRLQSTCWPKRYRGQGSSKPKSISVKDRVNEFSDECLTVTKGGLHIIIGCRFIVVVFLNNRDIIFLNIME